MLARRPGAERGVDKPAGFPARFEVEGSKGFSGDFLFVQRKFELNICKVFGKRVGVCRAPDITPNHRRGFGQRHGVVNDGGLGKGRGFVTLCLDARTEIRKVVWPTRQETTQTTIVVLIVIFIVALILWLLDWGLNSAVSGIIG